jgi:CHAT domain-containing protein/tetratricopeptide (TPR) repeat protein
MAGINPAARRSIPQIALVLSCLVHFLPATRGQPVPLDEPKGKAAAKLLPAAERTRLQERALALAREADLQLQAHKLPEAEQSLRQAVALFCKLYPAGHPLLATTLNNQAFVLQAQGRLAAAEPLYMEALAMRQRLYPAEKYPAGHPDLAQSLNNLALLQKAQGRLSTAEPLYREALAMYRRLYPAEKYPAGHLDLARSLNNLALLLQAQGRLSAAEPLCREAQAMCQRLYPVEKYPAGHPDLAQSVNSLAYLLHEQGRLSAAGPLYREALAMRQRLYPAEKYPAGHPDLARSLNNLASLLQGQGRLSAAEPLCRDTLAMYRRLYPAAKYPAGHPDLALSLNNLAVLLKAQGRLSAAEPLYREALAMCQRLYPAAKYPAGHPDLAQSLNNLALLLQAQGRLSAAEPLYRQALAMCQRLYPAEKYPAGHPDLAQSLNNLASLLQAQGRLSAAEPLCRDALAMDRRLYPAEKYPAGHPDLARSLNNLASLLEDRGRPAAAESLYRDALAMRQRLYPAEKYPAGHPDLAQSLNNLASLLHAQGWLSAAEPLYREALAMYQRLYPAEKYPAGHPYLAQTLNNLASLLLEDRGRPAAAEPLCREALAIYRRLAEEYALGRSEGETLNFLATMPLTLDVYLSVTDRPGAEPFAVYDVLWQAKAATSRVYQHRHLATRAATASPKVRKVWDELSGLRRQRADLLLAVQPGDPETRTARDKQLHAWTQRIDALQVELREALPELARAQDLVARTPVDLQRALPKAAALVDFFRYTRLEFDPKKPGKEGAKRTDWYVAFVLTSKAIVRIELGAATAIDKNVTLWRQAFETEPGEAPADIPHALGQQVWDKVAVHLPAAVRTVFLAPEQRLAFLPFAALPGKRPGTVLLEDHALAVVANGPFLLDRLTNPKQVRGSVGMLAMGGVAYDQTPAIAKSTDPDALRAPVAVEGKSLTWKALPGTAKETERIVALARAAGIPVKTLSGAEPSSARLVHDLPGYRYAHLATHGFFADPSFRSRLKVDEALFAMQGRERVGSGALSPFVLSGIVCAGANLKDTPGRGLLTAEALLNADLSGMELAVLSACETGLGEVGGGEGVLGLQRGFHVAGCKNVIASLWKVDDEATAALMQLFYRNLWQKKQPPLEALRQAQLALYHHPEQLAGLARGERTAFERVELPRKAGHPAAAQGQHAPVRQWAAFTLSGRGH